MKHLWLWLMLVCGGPLSWAQAFTDATAAFAEAQQTHKPVLLVFSGSDWCAPCIRLEKEVLSQPGFESVLDGVVKLHADFPQRTKQSKALRIQNEQLAERFNPQGAFPHLVLLSPAQEVLQVLDTRQPSVSSLTAQIRPWLTPMTETDTQIFTHTTKLMGSAFAFQVVAADEPLGQSYIDLAVAEIQRLEALLSIYQPQSDISLINQHAGEQAVAVSPEVFGLIDRSKRLAHFTQGAFDPTAGLLKRLYRFKEQPATLPDSQQLKEAMNLIGYQGILLVDSQHVKLAKKGMMLDFGAIGKGFAADQAKKVLKDKGVKAGVINASGDLTAWGTRPDGDPWTVGISDPTDTSRILLWLPLQASAIATSGNYEQYFEIDGKRYAHTIDPKTGYPAQGILSVSVISPSAELSDALATALSVMGIEVGINLINQLPDTHCIIIDEQQQIHSSKDLDVKLNPHE